jgi:acetyl-CoA C-acetyltransferase
MGDVYIISAVRTPIGRFGGALKEHSPVDLAAHVMKAALDRAAVEGGALDLYLFGNVLRSGHGQLIPRQAAIRAGIPEAVDGTALDMVCSSGMMSVMTGAAFIKAGEADLILCGGTESMSGTGFYLSHHARWGYRILPGKSEPLVDLMLRDGLTDPLSGEAMGVQTERLVAEHGITREELDEAASLSHHRAAEATEKGSFADEIAPMELSTGGNAVSFERDEGIRAETTPEKLSALRPAYMEDGVLTAGNSSQISDGAAALMLASEEAVEAHRLKPLARLLGSGWAAGASWRFPEAPVPAVQSALEKSGISRKQIELFENNEAFAVNNVLFSRMLDVPPDRLNVHGGAVALGHPIGASGARITTTLVHALRQRGGGRGVAAICHGTGGGTALVLELV